MKPRQKARLGSKTTSVSSLGSYLQDAKPNKQPDFYPGGIRTKKLYLRYA